MTKIAASDYRSGTQQPDGGYAETIILDGAKDGTVTTGWDGSALSMNGFGYAVIEVTTYGGTPLTVMDGIVVTNAIQVFRRSDNTLVSTITGTGLYRASADSSISLSALSGSVVNLIRKRG